MTLFCRKFYVQVFSVNLKASSRTAAFTTRPTNVHLSEQRGHTHLPADSFVRQNCPCANVFHSTANISIVFFAEEREQRQKGVNADLCSLNRSQEACQERVDMSLLSLYFSC